MDEKSNTKKTENKQISMDSRNEVKVRDEFREGSVQRLSLSFRYREFGQRSLSSAINQLVIVSDCDHKVYGIICRVHVSSRGKLTTGRAILLWASPYQMSQLCLLDKRSMQYSQLSVFDIASIEPGSCPTELSKEGVQKELVLAIQFRGRSGGRTLFLEFSTIRQRDLVQQGIQHFCIEETYRMQFVQGGRVSLNEKELRGVHQGTGTSGEWQRPVKEAGQERHESRFKQVRDRLRVHRAPVHWRPQSKLAELTLNDFCESLPLVLAKEEVRDVFRKYAVLSRTTFDHFEGCMTLSEFRRFLEEQQGVFLGESQIEDLMLNLKQSDKQQGLSFINFSEYLFSANNEIMATPDPKTELDLDHPLSEYFINSACGMSHFNLPDVHILRNIPDINESCHPLLYLLLRGVRHFELELWVFHLTQLTPYQEGEGSTPVCLYGPMQSFQTQLSDLLLIIRKYAFRLASSPVIICLDEHYRKEMKSVTLQLFQTTLGDLLVPVKILPPKPKQPLPTLRELSKKIILYGQVRNKNKHQRNISETDLQWFQQQPPVEDEGALLKDSNVDFFRRTNSALAETMHRNFLAHQQRTRGPEPRTRVSSPIQRPVTEFELLKDKLVLSGVQTLYTMFQVSAQMANELQDKLLIFETSDQLYQNILSTKKHQQSLYRQKVVTLTHLPSLKESSELNSVSSDYILPLEQAFSKECSLTSTHLVKWSKTSSKLQHNTCSSQGFLQQVQMVMMKHHVIDYNYLYYYAMFSGYCGSMAGFVLRPQRQSSEKVSKRQSLSAFSQSNSQVGVANWAAIGFLTVKVISGRQLSCKDTKLKDTKIFVQVILREPRPYEPERCQQEVTEKVEGNTFNPVFEKEMAFELQGGGSAFFSVLMFVVYNGDFNHMLYWNAVSVRNVRQGYRVVPLLDEKLNNVFNSYLFVRISVN